MTADDCAVIGRLLVGRYQIESVIGQGSFGRVYRATDRQTGKTVALKEFIRQPGQTDSFLRELGILFELHHPHVIDCQTLVMGGRFRYLVCEYMDGGSLRDLLQSGRATTEVLVRLLLQVCDGVAYAHDRNVVHRDLKPENILLGSKSGSDGWHAKVSDFGISTVGTSVGMRSSIGSPAYMAPEQFYEQYDARVDIYALGVMLYEIIVGRRPFVGSPAQLMTGHIRLEPEIPEWLPKPLARILKKALAKKPDRRYSTIESFREALRLALASEASRLDVAMWPIDLGDVLEVGHARNEVLVRRANDVLRLDGAGRLIETQPPGDRIACAEDTFLVQRGETMFVSTPMVTRAHRGLPRGADVALAADGTIACVADGKAIVVDSHGRHVVERSGERIDAVCFVGTEQTLCLAVHMTEGDVESYVTFAGARVRTPLSTWRLHGHPRRYEVIARAGEDRPDIALVRPGSMTHAQVDSGDFSCDGEAFFAVTREGDLASVNVGSERIAKTRWESMLRCISAGRTRFIWATREGRVLCT